MSLQPNLMAKTLISAMKQIQRDGFDFDVIDVFYLYPDAVAAAIAAEYFGKPLVATAFGNDLSLIAANSPRAARRILWAVDKAERCTTVCRALEDILVDMGANPSKVQVILHGVDAELFKPAQNRDVLRSTLGISGPTLLTAGHLIERKGIHIAVEALKYLPTFSLLIAGDGPEDSSLKTLALKYGVSDRITFLGHVNQAALAEYYAASDAFILMSSREGIANVMMESMSCGTPVVATNVYGAPEIITCPEAGILIPSRTVSALVTGIEALFSNMPTRDATRNHASQFNWSETTRNHVEIYKTFNLKY
jgi:teichuronic acid biosynthesis glycosyltransferase TuaC